MSQKEATVYIVDCGQSMARCDHGRQQTNLDWSLEYVWDKLTATVATARKTLLAGVIGLRTDGTQNLLDEEEEYANITVFQELSQVLMPQMRQLRKDLVPSSTVSGDAISALIVAIQMISNTCKKLAYQRKIVLVTDARGPMQTDDLPSITQKLKDDGIELVVLGVDFDDAEYGFKEENKDPVKRENEAVLEQLCKDCDGVYGTLMQAVDELSIPRVKTVKPVPSYRGHLTLGNPEDYDTALSIDVERYPKTMKASAPSASSFVIRTDMAAAEATQSTQSLDGDEAPNGAAADGLASVKNARTYQVADENAPGGKKDVDRDELAKGYEYGRTAVHISESDQNVVLYETTASFDIIGFVNATQYQRFLDMSRTNVVVAMKNNDKASMALSSFINALFELESYAVARFVAKDNREPRILLLAPNVEQDLECLYDIELPFAEDLRSYKFPPLDRVVTVSGKVLKVHRNLPSDGLMDAMSSYVDSMDLSTFGKSDEGEPVEYAPPDETFSPLVHRINQVIKHRAVYPDTDPPPPHEVLTRHSHPPEELVEAAQPALDRIVKAADVKKVPPKARGRRYGRKEAPKPLSDLDVNALLAQDPSRKNKRIDPNNAIPEFKQLIEHAEEPEQLTSACNQLAGVIEDWIRHSVGDSGYGRAIEAIRVMREEMSDIDMGELYNSFMRAMKPKLLGEELGGERRDMFGQIRRSRLGLLTEREVADGAKDEEAADFMKFTKT
ncbi:SPOC domain-like protein [Hortaea werneckii]|nr:SPOC domain-like protein [Hortaea werneckii]KAI6995629.1 SPOC domain-like protein [Hortaea werneckii]KAI7146443.1 SPOC domain-like protein [Hortaea werneckii]KAI7177819.1 SPOC domain-like protein [Hortaea werneckii]